MIYLDVNIEEMKVVKELIGKARFKEHLLTAISYMIPIVCGAGFIIAIGMAFGGKSQDALVIGKFNFFKQWPQLVAKGLECYR